MAMPSTSPAMPGSVSVDPTSVISATVSTPCTTRPTEANIPNVNLGRKDREAHAIAELAQSEEHIPDIVSARQHFEQARELAAEAGDEKSEANILNNLGMLHAERAEAWEASRSLADALVI